MLDAPCVVTSFVAIVQNVNHSAGIYVLEAQVDSYKQMLAEKERENHTIYNAMELQNAAVKSYSRHNRSLDQLLVPLLDLSARRPAATWTMRDE